MPTNDGDPTGRVRVRALSRIARVPTDVPHTRFACLVSFPLLCTPWFLFTMTGADARHMARALALAERGPVHDHAQSARRLRDRAEATRSSAKAGTRRAGGPHAEVIALAAAGERARGATAYVTLEPCAHHGRTPPCADALVECGHRTCRCRDERSESARRGQGTRRLREAGVAVQAGIMEDEARELNMRLRFAHDARAAMGADEDRSEPRRQDRALERPQPVDHGSGGAARRPPLARARLRGADRHRHRARTTTRS